MVGIVKVKRNKNSGFILQNLSVNKTDAELDTYANDGEIVFNVDTGKEKQLEVGSVIGWVFNNSTTGRKDTVYATVKSINGQSVTSTGVTRTYSKDTNTTYTAGANITIDGNNRINATVPQAYNDTEVKNRLSALENENTNDFIHLDSSHQTVSDVTLTSYANQKNYNQRLTAEQYKEVKVGATLAWTYTNRDSGKKDIVYYTVKSKEANNYVIIDGVGRTYSPTYVGKNLFPNSSFMRPLDDSFWLNPSSGNQWTYSIDISTKFAGYTALKLTASGSPQGDNRVTVKTNDSTRYAKDWANKEVWVSFWAKADRNMVGRVQSGARPWVWFNLTTNWQYFQLKIVENKNSDAWAEVGFSSNSQGTYWVAMPKVEQGTFATPYSLDCKSITKAFKAGNGINIDENGTISANILKKEHGVATLTDFFNSNSNRSLSLNWNNFVFLSLTYGVTIGGQQERFGVIKTVTGAYLKERFEQKKPILVEELYTIEGKTCRLLSSILISELTSTFCELKDEKNKVYDYETMKPLSNKIDVVAYSVFVLHNVDVKTLV